MKICRLPSYIENKYIEGNCSARGMEVFSIETSLGESDFLFVLVQKSVLNIRCLSSCEKLEDSEKMNI